MRSDFLGDCAEFKGLAEAVNEGEYLIPRLNRKQRARAIEGPVKVGGAEISPRLKQQLLNDIGDDPDQLPILQHALMRMWDYWLNNAKREQALDLDHYDGIGRMTEALSRHGDEVYEELPDDNHRLLCMKLFKAITEKQGDGRGVRRPLPFSEIDEITGHQREKMLTVIDAYRPIGRTFIMPGQNVKIHDKIIIDISHESLMRVWQRLKNWVNDEADSARIYIRLCETAQLHNRGEAGFYRDPDLKIALAWRDNNKPNANWGTRINDSFELAMRFLDDSSEDFEAEQKAKEEARKRELEQAKALAKAERERAEIQKKSAKRSKVFAVFLFALACFAGVMAYMATEAENRAVASERKAQDNLSYSYATQSDKLLSQNKAGKSIALLGQQHLENKDYDILPRKIANQLNHNPFLRESRNVYKNSDDILLRARKGFIYTKDYKDCIFLHNSKKNAYVKRIEISTGHELFVTEKLNYVDELNISPNENYIFVTGTDLDNNFCGIVINKDNGSFVKKYKDQETITAISGNDDLSRVIVGNYSGDLFVQNEMTNEILIEKNYNYKIHQVKISPDGKKAVVMALKDDSYYDIWQIDLVTLEDKLIYQSPRDQVRWEAWLQYSVGGKYIIQIGGDWAMGYINVFDANSGELKWKNDSIHKTFVITADVSHDQTTLATSSIDKTVRLWDLETGKQVMRPLLHDGGIWYAVFSPDQMKIATLTDQNDVWVWSTTTGKLLNFPTRQDGELVGISFDKSGEKLYTASIDGKFLEWSLNTPTYKPIILTHDGKINTYDMNNDGSIVITGGKDKKIIIWDAVKLKKINELLFEYEIVDIIYSNDNSKMVILEGVGHGEVKKWNLYSMPDMKLISSNNFPKNTHGGAAVSHNCEYIVYGLRDNLCHVIKTGSGETTHVITDHGGWVDGIQFSPKSDLFITLCKDSTARAYDPVSGLLKHNNEFRGLYGSRCTFSNEGEIYILYSQIGLDADTPVAFDAKTGERLFNLHHGNGVSDILFSDDDQTLISGSRDFTAKMWDRNNTEFPLHSYNVGEWVMSVLMKPSHPNRLFLFSRNGDINIYDAEKELYVDGPYRGSKDLNIFNMKLKTKPEADYFLALNTPNAVALWPFSIPEVNLDNTENLVSFSAAVTGVTMDKSKALQVVANNVQSLKIKANLLSGDNNLKKWKDWLVKGHSSKNPFVKVKPTQVRQFLIAQNTLPSLEEVLCNYPMDRAVLKLYASKLDEFSNDPEIQDYKRQRYRVSAEWYKSISQ